MMPDWDIQGRSNATDSPLIFGGFALQGYAGEGDPAPAPGPGDGASPVVQNVSPDAGSSINPDSVLSFEVIDADANLFDVVVFAIFVSTGTWEVVWDGEQFSPRYLQGSIRASIANGFRYTLKRTGNWPESPKIRVRAFDSNRNPLS